MRLLNLCFKFLLRWKTFNCGVRWTSLHVSVSRKRGRRQDWLLGQMLPKERLATMNSKSIPVQCIWPHRVFREDIAGPCEGNNVAYNEVFETSNQHELLFYLDFSFSLNLAQAKNILYIYHHFHFIMYSKIRWQKVGPELWVFVHTKGWRSVRIIHCFRWKRNTNSSFAGNRDERKKNLFSHRAACVSVIVLGCMNE